MIKKWRLHRFESSCDCATVQLPCEDDYGFEDDVDDEYGDEDGDDDDGDSDHGDDYTDVNPVVTVRLLGRLAALWFRFQ